MEVLVNSLIKNDIATVLKSIYKDDASAKAILDYLATRKKAMQVSTVDRISYTAKVAHQEVVRVFKELANAGCGIFYNGRKGYKSRIEWSYSLVSLAEVAKGQAALPEPIDLSAVEEEDDEIEGALPAEPEAEGFLPHTFQLRQEVLVRFSLPADLTAREADRLAAFIRTLPFE